MRKIFDDAEQVWPELCRFVNYNKLLSHDYKLETHITGFSHLPIVLNSQSTVVYILIALFLFFDIYLNKIV